MARTIWKFPLGMEAQQTLGVGGDPRIVHVAVQHDVPCVWVEHDPSLVGSSPPLRVEVVGTGHTVPAEARHAGTFTMSDGRFVFHVYAQEPGRG